MSRSLKLWIGAGLVALLTVTVATAALTDARGRTTLDPDAATPGGSRALAELLRGQGVTVERTVDAERAWSLGDGTTLVVAYPWLLSADDITRLEQLPSDILLLGPVPAPEGYLDVTPAASAPLADRDPQCLLDAAVRSGGARTGGTAFAVEDATGDDRTDRCFEADGLPTLVQISTATGATHTIMGSAEFMTNEWLDDAGNAALAMNLAGGNPAVVWWLPTPQYSGQQSLTSLLPDGVWPMLAAIVIAVLATAAWRARRLGPLTVESLPVAVRASETTEGRARIYQRHRTRERAAEHLRSNTVDVLCLRLGLPLSSSNEAVTATVASATGRRPDEVHQILYGPPPQGDSALVWLGRQLSAVEQEVRRA